MMESRHWRGCPDGDRHVLGSGNAYYFDSRQPHRFRCIGPEPCKLVSARTPPTFREIIV
jgi:hypothetical protein